MWRSVLLMLLVGAMAVAQEDVGDRDEVYPSETPPDLAGLSPVPPTPVILQSALNYWKMDESGLDDRVDSIGTDDLTANEAITTFAGKNGNAANFDLSTHSLISTAFRANSAGFSISAWVRRDDFSVGNAWWVTENVASNPGFLFYVRNDGEGTGVIRNASTTTIVTTGSFNLPITTGWVHYCVTWNADDNVFMYIDGVLRGTSAGTMDGTVRDASAGIKFGSAQAGGNDWAGGNEGYTDEVAIWDTGIGATGCADIYDAGEGKFWP